MRVVCWRCASHKARCSYTLPAPEIGALVGRLVQAPPVPSVAVDAETATRLATEVQITAENGVFEKGIMQLGVLTPFTCPECHGGFRRIAEGQMSQFRCHTGHAWTSDNVVYVNQRMFFARSIPHGVVFMESVIDVAHGAYDRREV